MDRDNVEGVYPLAPQQLGMLLESLRDREAGMYIEQAVYVLRGALNVDAFQGAWQRVVDRHSILRTAFVWKQQDEPLQVVLRRVEVSIERHDLREVSPHEQERQLQEYVSGDAKRGFDASAAPLMRLALFRVSEDVHHLVWTQHHILLDGWSLPTVKAEVLAFYEALSEGREIRLDPARPYRDYLAWLKRQDVSVAERFWREELRGFTQATALGFDIEPSETASGSERFCVQDASLSSVETAALRTTARQSRVTLNTILQATWALLLHRYSGSEEVLFGTTVSGRPAELPGVDSMVGLFVNTLPFRIRVPTTESLVPWLQAIQQRHLSVRAHEYSSSGQVHQWSEMQGSRPLYESILVFENYPSASSVPESKSLELDDPQSRYFGARTNYAITILVGVGDELWLRLVHDTRRIDERDAGRIRDHFVSLLRTVATSPAACFSTAREIPDEQVPHVRALGNTGVAGARVAPRTSVERLLLDLFSKAFGLREVGVRDNFFELGGHSLLAVRVFELIRKATGRTLPLATLLQAPTVEKLAEILEQENWSPPWSSLVAIQPGGSKSPLYCVRAVGGNVLTYRDLSRYLGPDQPVYGLQAKGLDGKEAPHTSVEAMAAHYLKEIRTLQPKGPYHLAGSSFGGAVAYEMAQQLRREGETVGVLALFDTWGPGYPRPLPGVTRLSLMMQKLWRRVDLHLGNLMLGGPKEKWTYIVVKFRRVIGKVKKLAARWRRKVKSAVDPLPRALRDVDEASAKALWAYVPLPYPGVLTLFRASKQPAGIYPDPTLGWGSLAVGGLESYEVPGYHGAIVYEPRVNLLAAHLRACLEKASKVPSRTESPAHADNVSAEVLEETTA